MLLTSNVPADGVGEYTGRKLSRGDGQSPDQSTKRRRAREKSLGLAKATGASQVEINEQEIVTTRPHSLESCLCFPSVLPGSLEIVICEILNQRCSCELEGRRTNNTAHDVDDRRIIDRGGDGSFSIPISDRSVFDERFDRSSQRLSRSSFRQRRADESTEHCNRTDIYRRASVYAESAGRRTDQFEFAD